MFSLLRKVNQLKQVNRTTNTISKSLNHFARMVNENLTFNIHYQCTACGKRFIKGNRTTLATFASCPSCQRRADAFDVSMNCLYFVFNEDFPLFDTI